MHEVNRDDVRRPAVAGAFYPDDEDVLGETVRRLLEEAEEVPLKGKLQGLVAPHAGYMYSGPVAATAFKLLEPEQFPVVVVISPSHREYFRGVSVFNGKGYETPLGLVPVASEVSAALIEQDPAIQNSWAGHRDEHALEVELPFLQKTLGAFSLVPVVMGNQDYDTCTLLGEALGNVLTDVPALIVASSDLSHYYSYEEALKLDRMAAELIEAFDEEQLMNALEAGRWEACGGGPIVATVMACKKLGVNASDVLLYMNSGDVTGDYSAVVGYLSAGFVRA